jgi:hypothetical protein
MADKIKLSLNELPLYIYLKVRAQKALKLFFFINKLYGHSY